MVECGVMRREEGIKNKRKDVSHPMYPPPPHHSPPPVHLHLYSQSVSNYIRLNCKREIYCDLWARGNE